jgi:competence protein ComEC
VYSRATRSLVSSVAASGARPLRVAAGDTLRFGSLRLEFLWPPRELALSPVPSGDPNSRSLVAVARWRRFGLLLTGDAEGELAPVEPGPVDVLKVAHHGSADPGLGALLRRATPRLAVISVGDNPFGHPAPEALAELEEAGVEVLRTDHDGDVTLEVRDGRFEVDTG